MAGVAATWVASLATGATEAAGMDWTETVVAGAGENQWTGKLVIAADEE